MSTQTRDIFTFANILSMGRLVLLVPLYFFLHEGREGNWLAMGVMGVALLTDLLDGLIARHFHQESEWGKVLDPLADKIWIGFLALFLAMPWREPPLPVYFLAALLIRYTIILAGAWYAHKRTGIIMVSNWFGKVTMVCEALTLIVYTIYMNDFFQQVLIPDVLMWVTIGMMAISTVAYARSFKRLMAAHYAGRLSQTSSPIKLSS